MGQRKVLSFDKVDGVAATAIAAFHADAVAEVEAAIAKHNAVIVGMGGNPLVKKACKALENAGVPFHVITHGNYLSQWRKRLAIKLWSGWPTFPQVFINGSLIGGCSDLEKLIASGKVGKKP